MKIILLLLSFFSTKTYIIDANTNYLKSNIIINKTDINNDGIASATFNLYKDNKIINTYKTDDNGRIILSLDNGKYTLKETTKTTWFKLEKINLNVENKDLTINFKSKRIKPCGIRIINFDDNDLTVILMVGVNGAGKTTTIAKLAHKMIDEGKTVMVAAGDTFRAGAIDQLDVWAQRLGIECVKGKEGGDPSSVVFDALNKAKEKGVDVLICDTAGRLQNKVNLMNELEKMNRIIKRVVPNGPQETLLVIDATTGQNGVSQAQEFSKITDITGIVLTKMDGTAKGGIVLSIKDHLNIPVKFIGLGESMDDLQEFDLEQYIYGLCKNLMEE